MDNGDEVVTATVTPVTFNNTWKGVITIGTFLFNGGIIAYLLYRGDAANSLRSMISLRRVSLTSAMSWAFTVDILILAGLGIGAFTPAIIDGLTKK